MQEKKARIGVIGAGWWATDTHIPTVQSHPDARLVAICDADEQRLGVAADRYQIDRRYQDYHEMLQHELLDGVIIVTSNTTHYEIAKTALEHDVHVMLEKPMTIVASEAKELVELARVRERELIVGYPFNFAAYAVRAAEVIRSGELGAVQFINLVYNSYMTPLFAGNRLETFRVHAPDQYTRPELLGGGHGQVQVTHAAGLLFHVTQERPRQVCARMANHGLAVDLVDAMTVEFDSGALGTVGGSGNFRGMTCTLQVCCENGWLHVDAGAGTAAIHRDNGEVEVVDDRKRTFPLETVTAHNLIEVIGGRANNGSPAEVGWRAVELLDAAYRSAAQQGHPITIEELYS